jgi:acetylcholinesterase
MLVISIVAVLALMLFSDRQSAIPAVTIFPGPTTYLGLRSSDTIEEFRGIRYGQAPSESLRFLKPRPYRAPGIMHASQYGPGCPQNARYATSQGLAEDCLYLNVVRPAYRSGVPLPVIFWLHGGANNNGQGALYNGSSLVTKSVELDLPIIYITINYRLNGFGFFASSQLAELDALNVGLHDQELALQWVHAHIAEFGGDRDRVLLIGESAGSADIWAHLSKAPEEGTGPLFSTVAMMSGAPGGLWPHGMYMQLTVHDCTTSNTCNSRRCFAV